MKVSIITPVLNRKDGVWKLACNIAQQTHKDIEHIFVDGGSTDGTLRVIQEFRELHPKVKYISEPDRGIGDAVNKGWAMATGDILGWIDVGDWYEADAIESVVKAFQDNLLTDVVYGGGRMFDSDGKFLRNYITEDFNWNKTRDNVNQMHTPPSAFYRREVIRVMPNLPNSGDNLELHLLVGYLRKIKRIDKTIFNIGLQKDSVTFSNSKVVKGAYRTSYEVCRKYGGSIFAPRCVRYYLFTILDKLHLYNFVALGMVKNLRRISFANKLMSKLGLVTN